MTEPDTRVAERPDLRQQVGTLAQILAAEHFPRGDLAALRRMDPDRIDAPAFWRLAAQVGFLGDRADGPWARDRETRWACVIKGLALCTPTAGRGTGHDPHMPLGRALFLDGYSEQRLSRLLAAPADRLPDTALRAARFLAAKGRAFNWTELTALILFEGASADRAEPVRRAIARAYYGAEAKAAADSSEQS